MNIQVGIIIIPTIGHKLQYISVNHCVATLSDIPTIPGHCVDYYTAVASCNAMGLLILLTQFRIHKLSSIGHLGNRLPAYTYTQTQLRKVQMSI